MTGRRRLDAGATCAVLALAAVPRVALAHSLFEGAGDFYSGMLHPLTALEHVLPFFAFGLLAGQHAERGRAMLPLFALSLVVGALASLGLGALPGLDLLNVAAVLVLGALVAVGRPPPPAAYAALAGLFGLSHGYANGLAIEPEVRWYVFIPGVGLAGLVVTALGFLVAESVARRRSAWLPITVRVAGSWIAAIGLLVLATTLRPAAV